MTISRPGMYCHCESTTTEKSLLTKVTMCNCNISLHRHLMIVSVHRLHLFVLRRRIAAILQCVISSSAAVSAYCRDRREPLVHIVLGTRRVDAAQCRVRTEWRLKADGATASADI